MLKIRMNVNQQRFQGCQNWLNSLKIISLQRQILPIQSYLTNHPVRVSESLEGVNQEIGTTKLNQHKKIFYAQNWNCFFLIFKLNLISKNPFILSSILSGNRHAKNKLKSISWIWKLTRAI